MMELQRPILLPAPSGASPAPGGWLVVPGMPMPVEPVPAVCDLGARQSGRGPSFDHDGVAAADRGTGRARRSPHAVSLADEAAGRGRPQVGSLAFLAQQIYQEELPSGLYREPWAEALGAYRLAGAEPPLESAAPALVSFSV